LVDALERRFDELESELAKPIGDPNDGDVVAEMRRRGAHEISDFRHLAALYRASAVAAEREIIARNLWSTYHLTFWELVGTKG
jgi:hypothetical protein